MTMRYCLAHGVVPPTHRCTPHAKRNQKLRRLVAHSTTTCYLCGQSFTSADPPTADHLISQSQGGTDTVTNLRAAHRSCNSKRGGGL